MKKQVYLLKNITEFGKFISFCIYHDISVWRLYWDERETGDRCYRIDGVAKMCSYAYKSYWEENGYEVVEPKFRLTQFGFYEMEEIHK